MVSRRSRFYRIAAGLGSRLRSPGALLSLTPYPLIINICLSSAEALCPAIERPNPRRSFSEPLASVGFSYAIQLVAKAGRILPVGRAAAPGTNAILNEFGTGVRNLLQKQSLV